MRETAFQEAAFHDEYVAADSVRSLLMYSLAHKIVELENEIGRPFSFSTHFDDSEKIQCPSFEMCVQQTTARDCEMERHHIFHPRRWYKNDEVAAVYRGRFIRRVCTGMHDLIHEEENDDPPEVPEKDQMEFVLALDYAIKRIRSKQLRLSKLALKAS